MKTSVYADDAKNHFLKCFNKGMCLDLPRYPDNKVEKATLFLYSSKKNFAVNNCCKRYLINMP